MSPDFIELHRLKQGSDLLKERLQNRCVWKRLGSAVLHFGDLAPPGGLIASLHFRYLNRNMAATKKNQTF